MHSPSLPHISPTVLLHRRCPQLLSSLLSTTKYTPLALNTSIQRCSYIESDKIKLSLVLPHQVCCSQFTYLHTSDDSCHWQTIFTFEDIVQANILATSGNMCILTNHVPSIKLLHPGILEVIESGNTSKKWLGKAISQYTDHARLNY